MVKVIFAYYDDFGVELGFPPLASYLIEETDNDNLPLYGNVGVKTLQSHRVEVPVTPTFEEWTLAGKPIYRGA